MCIIVDANLAAIVFNSPPPNDFYPLIDWLTRGEGKLVIGGKLSSEIDRVTVAKRFIRALLQAGKARVIPSTIIDIEIRVIANLCESNDQHIIALARAGGARILCSHDTMLHRDFTNLALISIPRGHVYQNANHSHLLRLYGHTEACRRSMGQQ